MALGNSPGRAGFTARLYHPASMCHALELGMKAIRTMALKAWNTHR